MQKLFTEIIEWQKVTFPSSTPLSKLKHLQKEIIEVEEDIQSGNDNIIFEMADMCFLMFGIIDQLGFTYDDLVHIVAEKLRINKTRTWQAPDKDGVVLHIKE